MKPLLLKGAVWNAMARLLVNLVGFASTIILARLLFPADFGLVAISSAISAVVIAITELSLSEALVQHEAPDEADYHTAFTLNLIRGAILALVLAGLAWPVAALYEDERLVAIMLVLAGSTLVGGVTNPRIVVFHRQLQFHQEFFLSVSQKLVGLAVATTVALLYRNYWALVLGSVASQACAIVVAYALVPYRPRLSLAKWRDLMSFSIWLTLNFATRTINWRMDALLIGYGLGAGPAGTYSMADNLAGLPTREAIAPLSQTLFPAFSRIRTDHQRLHAAYLKAMAIICSLAFPIGVGFSAIAYLAVGVLLGPKWHETAPIIAVSAAAIALQAGAWTVTPLASALGQTRAVFVTELQIFFLRLPFLVGGLWFGLVTDLGGMLGLIWGRAVAGLLGVSVSLRLVHRLTGMTILGQLRNMVRPAAASAAMFAAIALVFPASGTSPGEGLAELCAAVLLGAVVYGFVLFGLWRLEGRPDGPEAEAVGLVRRFVSPLRTG